MRTGRVTREMPHGAEPSGTRWPVSGAAARAARLAARCTLLLLAGRAGSDTAAGDFAIRPALITILARNARAWTVDGLFKRNDFAFRYALDDLGVRVVSHANNDGPFFHLVFRLHKN